MPGAWQADKSGGTGGELTGEIFDDGQRAHRVIFACQDQHRASDHGQSGPWVEPRYLLAEVMQVDVEGLDGPGKSLAEFFGITGLAAVERAADALELGGRFLAQLGEVALRDGSCMVAAQAAEYLHAAREIPRGPPWYWPR